MTFGGFDDYSIIYSGEKSANKLFAPIHNASSISLSQIPDLSWDLFYLTVCDAIRDGKRAVALFVMPSHGRFKMFGVFGQQESNLLVVSTGVSSQFPSLTPRCPQLHLFEREIAEIHGIKPVGHPFLKPVRDQHDYTHFFQVKGEEIHEVGVGPVHAGVIEPGHFRFQCQGETVLHLEIALGFQHRGIEQTLLGGPNKKTLPTMEVVAGDTSIGHATAYCQNWESLTDTTVSKRAQILRAVALELERLANHTGDLGALSGDAGFLPTAQYCGRLRGDFLNASALLCGSRLGRGMIRPGGVGFDVDDARIAKLLLALNKAQDELEEAVNLFWTSPSSMARCEGIGTITKEMVQELGFVGMAARSCEVARDVRVEFPTGAYAIHSFPLVLKTSGDVYARARLRFAEIQTSCDYIRKLLSALPQGAPCMPQNAALAPDTFAVSLVEGWRGEIAHIAITDSEGQFAHYKIIDPSFHNWMALAMALRNQQISDFPIINKSFNLSYCGFDL